jgi:hypothetical protein
MYRIFGSLCPGDSYKSSSQICSRTKPLYTFLVPTLMLLVIRTQQARGYSSTFWRHICGTWPPGQAARGRNEPAEDSGYRNAGTKYQNVTSFVARRLIDARARLRCAGRRLLPLLAALLICCCCWVMWRRGFDRKDSRGGMYFLYIAYRVHCSWRMKTLSVGCLQYSKCMYGCSWHSPLF